MARFSYGLSYEVINRRSEFFESTFDDMVGRIIELEADLEERTEERDELQRQVADLESEQ